MKERKHIFCFRNNWSREIFALMSYATFETEQNGEVL